MSLPFREEALIQLYFQKDLPSISDEEDRNNARMIQRLADIACEEWGHDWHSRTPMEIGSATIAAPMFNEMPTHIECARCGKLETKK